MIFCKVVHRFVKQARTYPGADINSDHNPVTIKFKVKLKKIKRNQAQSQIDYNLLKDDTYKRRYNILVKNYYDVLGSEKVEQTTQKVKKKKRGWMNDEILSKMEQGQNVKNKTTEYNVINKEIVDE